MHNSLLAGLRGLLIASVCVCPASRAIVALGAEYDPTQNSASPDASSFDLLRQTEGDAAAKSQGCVLCHQGVGDMHAKRIDGKPIVRLGCTDCHGGDPVAQRPPKRPTSIRDSRRPGRPRAIRSVLIPC